MAELVKRNKVTLRGHLGNYRCLCKKAMMLRAMESARARKKNQQSMIPSSMKRKRLDRSREPPDPNRLVKKQKSSDAGQERGSTLKCEAQNTAQPALGASEPKASDLHSSGDSWEVDSGFCSEASPPASGRSSPCPGVCPAATVVALDCEMVGTGPGGRCNELARCSILDYHGHILYDKYIRPCQPVTDYRTRWSGIHKHDLEDATPFAQAREEILSILEGKVVVGHAVYNDFRVLHMLHPSHMVRDTSSKRFLGCLAGFPRRCCLSLKALASKLLDRRIQVGGSGHCSVEDARAALDLYKLVEAEWEQEWQDVLKAADAPHHYMQDEFWPDDVMADSQ